MQTTYRINGMTCGHCEGAVKEELSGLSGVTDVTVSASDGTAVVTSESSLDEKAVAEAVDEAGFEVAKLPTVSWCHGEPRRRQNSRVLRGRSDPSRPNRRRHRRRLGRDTAPQAARPLRS